jgi:hypothetical protein
MPLLTGPALVAAALIGLAGAQKLVDPAMTVGALRALGLPSSAALVRAGSAAELALGAAALANGAPVVWWVLAASYVAFTGVVLAALRRGTMIGSCGCFGREDTPPHWSHVVVNLALAGTAAAAALRRMAAPVESLADDAGQAVVVVGLAALALYLLHAVYVDLPRTLVAGRPLPPAHP